MLCKFIIFKFCTILLEEAFLFDQWPRKLQKYEKLTSCDIHASNERTVIFQRPSHRWVDKRVEFVAREKYFYLCVKVYDCILYHSAFRQNYGAPIFLTFFRYRFHELVHTYFWPFNLFDFTLQPFFIIFIADDCVRKQQFCSR